MNLLRKLLQLLLIAGFTSCGDRNKISLSDEILNTEKSFEKLVNDSGLMAGFAGFAAPDAVISRNGKLIRSRDSIRLYYLAEQGKNITLKWTPEKIDVAASGDLAYTWGPYVYTETDSVKHVYRGFFHTVWKKQPDGNWRFVYD